MTSRAAIIAEEDAALRARYLTGTAVTKGIPLFKRIADKIIKIVQAAETGTAVPSQTQADLLKDISELEYQAQKLEAVSDANRREQQVYQRKQAQLEADIEQARQDIEAAKSELAAARLERQQLEEYEVLRRQVHKEVPRWKRQQQMQQVRDEIQSIQAECGRLDGIMERRRQQYGLLMYCLDDLAGLAHEQPDDQEGGEEECEGEVGEAGAVPMQVD